MYVCMHVHAYIHTYIHTYTLSYVHVAGTAAFRHADNQPTYICMLVGCRREYRKVAAQGTCMYTQAYVCMHVAKAYACMYVRCLSESSSLSYMYVNIHVM